MGFRSACRWALWSLRPAGFEHAQHAIGDQEAADDVAGGGDDGDGAEDGGELAFMFAGENDGADYGDGVERVGEGHQRRVEKRGDAANNFKSDKSGERENVEAGDQVQLHLSPPLVANAGNLKNSQSRAFTTSPPCVSNVSRMISSLVSI